MCSGLHARPQLTFASNGRLPYELENIIWEYYSVPWAAELLQVLAHAPTYTWNIDHCNSESIPSLKTRIYFSSHKDGKKYDIGICTKGYYHYITGGAPLPISFCLGDNLDCDDYNIHIREFYDFFYDNRKRIFKYASMSSRKQSIKSFAYFSLEK